MITKVKGQNGVLIVYDDRIVISRATLGGFVSQGGSSGDRTYRYEDIQGIEFKKPSLMSNGYLKVLVPGSVETNAKVGVFSSSMDSMKDQNTVVFRAFSSSFANECERAYAYIMDKISKAKAAKNTPVVQSAPVSKMDELKKLAELRDSGVLTDEEFQTEKRRLLSGN